jgi:hypothetical protein
MVGVDARGANKTVLGESRSLSKYGEISSPFSLWRETRTAAGQVAVAKEVVDTELQVIFIQNGLNAAEYARRPCAGDSVWHLE